MSPYPDAAESLRFAEETRGALARDLYLPGWYAPLYGLGTGAFVAAHALPTPVTAGAGMIAALLFVVLLYRLWVRRAGMRVSGYRAGGTRPIAIGVGVATTGLAFLAIQLRWSGGDRVAPLICGAVAAVAATLASRWFDRVWQREVATLG